MRMMLLCLAGCGGIVAGDDASLDSSALDAASKPDTLTVKDGAFVVDTGPPSCAMGADLTACGTCCFGELKQGCPTLMMAAQMCTQGCMLPTFCSGMVSYNEVGCLRKSLLAICPMDPLYQKTCDAACQALSKCIASCQN
jgi:hypothetical protein